MSGRLQLSDYPPNWREVSQYIRFERAQGRCECPGGSWFCGLHGTHPGPRRCVELDRMPAIWARGRVVLTVAHLCTCEPLCADPVHLKAMCNRCDTLLPLKWRSFLGSLSKPLSKLQTVLTRDCLASALASTHNLHAVVCAVRLPPQ